jgi:hypothetical protein
MPNFSECCDVSLLKLGGENNDENLESKSCVSRSGSLQAVVEFAMMREPPPAVCVVVDFEQHEITNESRVQ